MDLQHFEGAVCVASFGQLWSGSARQGLALSSIAVRLQALVSSRKLLWCDFSLNQCCRSTDLWLLRPWCSQSTPRTALQFESLNDQVPGNQPIRRQHVMSTPSSLLAFFHTGKLCLDSMVHLEVFFNHPVLSIIRFSCQLIFNKLLYTESVERKPLLALTKLLHGLHGLSFGKVTEVIWRSEKGKKLRNEQAPNWDHGLEVLFQLLPALACSPWQNIGAFMQNLRQS